MALIVTASRKDNSAHTDLLMNSGHKHGRLQAGTSGKLAPHPRNVVKCFMHFVYYCISEDLCFEGEE